MRRLFEFGGYAAGVILVAFGIATLVIALNGRSEVSQILKQEKIYGGDDMYPEAIRAAGEEAGLPPDTDYPDCAVYDPDKAAADSEYNGEPVDDGGSAKCFASYMRIHALESSGGLVYAEMGLFVAADDPENPAGTSDPEAAVNDEEGNPVPNAARNTWVTETALATALNTAFFAEQVSTFSIVVAIALILAGIGFAVLGFAAFHKPFHRARGEQEPGPAEGAS
jgi:uncharacterized membrane protein YidH (DUF202 family)